MYKIVNNVLMFLFFWHTRVLLAYETSLFFFLVGARFAHHLQDGSGCRAGEQSTLEGVERSAKRALRSQVRRGKEKTRDDSRCLIPAELAIPLDLTCAQAHLGEREGSQSKQTEKCVLLNSPEEMEENRCEEVPGSPTSRVLPFWLCGVAIPLLGRRKSKIEKPLLYEPGSCLLI